MEIDNHLYKILKYIKKHPFSKYEVLCNKFSNYEIEKALANLSNYDYLEESDYVTWVENHATKWSVGPATKYKTTSKANLLVETRALEHRRWAIPVIISIIALLSSIIGWFLPT